MTNSRATQKLSDLRRILEQARTANDGEPSHAALIDVVDGLITHAERQARVTEDLRSDLTHKQGIVTSIKGGEFQGPPPSPPAREFYASSNGDRWFLGRDDAEETVFVTHQANQPSGGATTRIDLSDFLNKNMGSPERVALLRLLGTLAETNP